MGFDLPADYKQVPERIADLKAKHPEATLQPADPLNPFQIVAIGGREFVVYTAACYRTPDDPRPGIGIAWEPFPGKTPYTKDSEMMNAETSAWGRAIVAALASESKAIASAEEVFARQNDAAARPARKTAPATAPAQTTTRRPPPSNGGPVCADCSLPFGEEPVRRVAGRNYHASCAGSVGGSSSAGAPGEEVGGAASSTRSLAGEVASPPSDGPSQPQLRLIHGTLKRLGVSEDDRHRFCGALIGRDDLDSFGDLDRAEVRQLIDALKAEEASVPS